MAKKLLILLLGLVVGLGLCRVQHHWLRHHPQRLDQFVSKLHLTPEQKETVRGILDEQREEMKSLRQETKQKMAGLREEARQKIRSQLTPEQQIKFDEIR